MRSSRVPMTPREGVQAPLITCRDEKHQVQLLGRFQGEGLKCRALLS